MTQQTWSLHLAACCRVAGYRRYTRGRQSDWSNSQIKSSSCVLQLGCLQRGVFLHRCTYCLPCQVGLHVRLYSVYVIDYLDVFNTRSIVHSICASYFRVVSTLIKSCNIEHWTCYTKCFDVFSWFWFSNCYALNDKLFVNACVSLYRSRDNWFHAR